MCKILKIGWSGGEGGENRLRSSCLMTRLHLQSGVLTHCPWLAHPANMCPSCFQSWPPGTSPHSLLSLPESSNPAPHNFFTFSFKKALDLPYHSKQTCLLSSTRIPLLVTICSALLPTPHLITKTFVSNSPPPKGLNPVFSRALLTYQPLLSTKMAFLPQLP